MMPVNGVMRPHFWGFEILTTSLLPNVATTLNGSIMLLLGDMNLSSSIGSRGGIEIKQSSQRLLDLDQILWRGRERMDIVNHDLGDNTTAGPLVGLLGN
jgi:HK97 family phage major capsid protein